MSKGHRSSLTRRVLSAVAILGSAQAVNIACSVVRTKFIAVFLGPAGIGLNSILINASTLITTSTQFNIRESSVRDLSLPAADIQKALRIAVVRKWALLLGLLGAFVMIAVSPLFSASAYDGSFDRYLQFAAIAPAVFFAAYSAGEFAIMQSQGRIKAIARANLSAGIIATVTSLPLIYLFGLRSIVPVVNIFAASIAACAACLRHKVSPLTLPPITFGLLWREGRSFLKLGVALSVSSMLTSLMNYIIAAYISSTTGQDSLGIYQSGYTLVNSYIGIIFSAIAVEYYPRLTRFIGRPKAVRTLMAHEANLLIKLITPVACLFVLAADLVVRLLYTSQFEVVLPYVTIAIGGTLFRGISLCFAYRILAAGDSRAFMLTEMFSVIVGLTLNIICYRYWSFNGLGVAYVIWYAFYAVLTATVCRLRYRITLPSSLFRLLIISIILIAITIILRLHI